MTVTVVASNRVDRRTIAAVVRVQVPITGIFLTLRSRTPKTGVMQLWVHSHERVNVKCLPFSAKPEIKLKLKLENRNIPQIS